MKILNTIVLGLAIFLTAGWLFATPYPGGGVHPIAVSDIADGTDGELITWDSSGVAAVVAVGTSTHVLTSNGAGSAPTFQAASGGGSFILGNTMGNVDIAQATTIYGPMFGSPGASAWATSETQVDVRSPMTFTAKNLHGSVRTAPVAGQTFIFTLREDGSDSTLTCTISNPATTCSDTVNTVSIAQGNKMNMRFVASATSGAAKDMEYSIEGTS